MAADLNGVQAVLDFMRENGLSTSQSALIEDVLERSSTRVESVELQTFLFPVAPRNIPRIARDESSDEFVSLGSSTSDLCSSEFTNPYGVRTTTEVSSQTSSERLSQFGTAREYHDFDIENDFYWYNEEEKDFPMPSQFDGTDLFVCPSEDKFIMTAETGKPINSELGYKHMSEGCESLGGINSMDKPWPLSLSSLTHMNGVGLTSYDNMKVNFMNRGVENVEPDVYKGSDLRCVQSLDAKGVLSGDDKFEQKCYKGVNEGETTTSAYEPEGGADGEEDTAERLIYDTNDDEYEVFHLRIIHRKNRTGFEVSKDLPVFLNSIIAGRYCVTEYLGSAAFSKVVQAQDLLTGVDVCLKIIKNDKEFFDQSLDEIKLLKFVNKHDPGDERHILRLYDYFYYQEHLFIVCELLRANLYEFQKHNQESGAEPYFTLSRIQLITRQCLEALEYLHYLGIIHCDLKPENILMKSYRRCEVKVIDLGSSCFLTDNLCLYVQSRSYRAPEVILGLPYDQKIDLWSLGCILAELYSGEVLFPNDVLVMLLARMIGILGPIDMDMLAKGQETHKYFTEDYDLYLINEETNQLEFLNPEKSSLEHHLQVSDHGFVNFVRDLLEINPQRRPTAREALEHPWLSHRYNP